MGVLEFSTKLNTEGETDVSKRVAIPEGGINTFGSNKVLKKEIGEYCNLVCVYTDFGADTLIYFKDFSIIYEGGCTRSTS